MHVHHIALCAVKCSISIEVSIMVAYTIRNVELDKMYDKTGYILKYTIQKMKYFFVG